MSLSLNLDTRVLLSQSTSQPDELLTVFGSLAGVQESLPIDQRVWQIFDWLLSDEPGRITKLSLGNKKLRHIPGEVFDRMPNLEKLSVSRNLLAALPEGIGKLTHLKHLTCTGTKEGLLTSISPAIKECTSLEDLDLARNPNLKELPDLSNLRNLKKSNLRNTGISENEARKAFGEEIFRNAKIKTGERPWEEPDQARRQRREQKKISESKTT